jgi:hypothetical protein
VEKIDLTKLADDVLDLIKKHGIEPENFSIGIAVSMDEYNRLQSLSVHEPHASGMPMIAVANRGYAVQITGTGWLKLKEE